MASEQAKRLGERAKERRDELGLKQREVAERMTGRPNVDSQVVSKWERGEHRPNDANLEALAEALETTVADLMSGPVAKRPQRPAETPDLMGSLNGGTTTEDMPAWAQELLANQAEVLANQAEALKRQGEIDEKLENALEFLAHISGVARRAEDSRSTEAAA